MHLEVRRAQGRTKYYLAHSFREGKEVRKIRRYLGENLAQKELAARRKAGEAALAEQLRIFEQIQDPLKTVLSNEESLQLKDLERSARIVVKHLTERQWGAFTETFTYDTNAIEGSTVTRDQVKGILEEKHWPKHASKEEVAETYGVARAVRYLRSAKDHLSLALIKRLHALVFRDSKGYAGRFRSVDVVVRGKDGTVIHQGAPKNRVAPLLRELVIWYHENQHRYSPIVLSAVVHDQFETIHPFEDGNGRIGRLLLNNILLKHGLPPVNISLTNRRTYYAALVAYQKHGFLRPTVELILRAYGRG